MKAFFKQKAFIRAAVIVLAASLLITGLFTACPNAAGGKTGGGSTPQSHYTVNFGVDGGNGTLTARGPNGQPITTDAEIEKGKTVSFTAAPDEGFMTDNWTISGGTPENPLAEVKINASLTVRVSFKRADSIPLSKLNIQGTVLESYTGEKLTGILRVPAYITEIADYAFKDCTGITEVHLPENFTEIGNSAFYAYSGIRKLTMGKNLTLIADYAFSECRNLEGRLEFPENLAEIGKGAFNACLKVSALDFFKCKKPLTIGTNAFYGTTGRFKVKTGTGIKELLIGSGITEDKIDEES